MRIVFLVNRDVESNLALNLLLPALGGRTAAVFLSERVGGGRGGGGRGLDPLGFVEQELFNDLVFPLAEARGAVAGRLATFDQLASRFGIAVRPIATLRDPAALDALRDAEADLFVSIRFGRILGAEALAIPRTGVLNLHSGLLPDYRGVLATFRALLHGDGEIGCTLHWIDTPAIDQGPIVSSARLPVERDRSLLGHLLALYPLGASLVLDAVERLERGETLATNPQMGSEGDYFSFPTDGDFARFTERGWRLFDREEVRELVARYLGAPRGDAPLAPDGSFGR